MRRPHIGLHLGQDTLPAVVVRILDLRNAVLGCDGTFSARLLRAVSPCSAVHVVGHLLVPGLVVDVWNARHFHTIGRLLLVQVLKRVLVEVNRSRSETLRSSLLVGPSVELVSDALEALANLLSCEQFVNRATVVSRPQLELLEMVWLRDALAAPSTLQG